MGEYRSVLALTAKEIFLTMGYKMTNDRPISKTERAKGHNNLLTDFINHDILSLIKVFTSF